MIILSSKWPWVRVQRPEPKPKPNAIPMFILPRVPRSPQDLHQMLEEAARRPVSPAVPPPAQRSLNVDESRDPLRILIVEDEASDIGGMLGITTDRQMKLQHMVGESIVAARGRPIVYAAERWEDLKHQNELFLATWFLAHASLQSGAVTMMPVK